MEDAALRDLVAIGLADQDDERGCRQHHDLDGVRHAHVLAAEYRPQPLERPHQHHQQGGHQEDPHRRLRRRFERRILSHRLHRIQLHVLRVLQPLLIAWIIGQLLAHAIDEHAGQADTQDGGGHRHLQHVDQRDVLRLKVVHDRDHRGRHRTGHDGELRGDHRHRQRPLGPDAIATTDLGNDRQHRVGHVTGTGHHREGIGHRRCDERDVARIAMQHPRRDPHQIVQAASRLHGSRGRDHRHDHHHHVDGGAGGLKVEAEGHHGQADTPEHAQSDAAHLRTDEDAQQDNGKLNGKKHDDSREASPQASGSGPCHETVAIRPRRHTQEPFALPVVIDSYWKK